MLRLTLFLAVPALVIAQVEHHVVVVAVVAVFAVVAVVAVVAVFAVVVDFAVVVAVVVAGGARSGDCSGRT